MNRFHTIILLLVSTVIPSTPTITQAQGSILVIDSISMRTDDVRDNSGLPFLKFGFGTDFTNGPDTANGGGEFPFPFIGGPSGFASSFAVVDFQGDPAYDYKDVRGIPDSVSGIGGVNYFSLIHTIRIQPGIGKPVVTTAGTLSRGIDSIVVRSTQPGANFHHTFFPNGGTVNVGRQEITDLEFEVYYNYNRAAAVPVATEFGAAASLALYPNPIRPHTLLQSSFEAPKGSRLVMANLLGTTVASAQIDERGMPWIMIPDLSAGLYIVRLVGADGTLVRQGSIVVDR